MVNSIICDTLSTKRKKPIDIQIYDYKQCFDGLWLEECLNDMYTGGLQDDKLNLLHEANSLVNIAVRTPVGKTSSGDINNVVIQGDVFGPMLCSKQVDQFGKECLEQEKYTYLYKGEVEIPPLSMVDDVICISECGYKTAMVNSFMQCKTSSKKLKFGVTKCKKMHIGKTCEDYKCHPLYVDSWKEIEKKNDETGKDEVKDICLGEEVMEEKDEEKYLGDIISKDGRNLKNIKARVNKGKGIVRQILNILEGIPFGRIYFQVAVLLRNSLLGSSLLCNSEAWFNLTNSELDLLETVDVTLLRIVLGAPKSSSKEMLYADSLLFKVLEKQCEMTSSKDWITSVIKDLVFLELHVTFSDIQEMGKTKWKSIVKNVTKEITLKRLEIIKQRHSKVKLIKHTKLEMQPYFLPDRLEMTKDITQLIFK